MKNYIIIMVLLTSVAGANYLVTENAEVYPGDTTYVYVPIKNPGTGTFMMDVSVRLVPDDNASARAVAILNDVYPIGTIDKWGEERTAKFRIHINPDAVEGDYYFNVYITSKGKDSDIPTTTKLEDRILTVKGVPTVILVNSTIDIVEPMSINQETLKFKNTGTGTIKNAVVEIDLAGQGLKSPFSILGGGTQFPLGTLRAGDEAAITFDLAVDIATPPGAYNLPIQITGQNNYMSTDYVGLMVAGTTDFEISYQETLGSFTLNVANVGVNPASAVTVTLLRQKNFSSTGSSSAVLGNLNPGDYTSALFQVTKIPDTGNNLDIEIQYTDTSGKRHQMMKQINVEFSSAGTRSRSGTGSSGGINYTLWLLLIAGIVIIYWQRSKLAVYYRRWKGGT